MSIVTVEQIVETIEKAKLIKNAKELKYSVPLSEQGIDSLDVSGMLLNMEEEFNVEIPDEVIDDLQTIDDILNYINSKVAE